ncbi:8546_t:CDS:2 [Diversispora eburnea]|uniref:8546_t:CDS:1 n=1 Tax=Diversispora eburnea TaxID=1213867 RepID=A0A9N8ZBK3_9GLOM|nr:8546_t:CDS:2 [Diversispora eburnea]
MAFYNELKRALKPEGYLMLVEREVSIRSIGPAITRCLMLIEKPILYGAGNP